MAVPSFDEWMARQQGLVSPLPQLSGSQSEPDYTAKLRDLLARGASTALEAASPVIDIITRPQAALSEAYGAHQAGDESPLAAALRGFTGGYGKAEYGTFGEQLIPEQPDEDFGTKAARFGVDVLTDPTTYIGGVGLARQAAGKGAGIVGRTIGAGLRKGVTPALKAAGAAVKRQPWAEEAGRYLLRNKVLAETFGNSAADRAGTEFAQNAGGAFEAADAWIGRALGELEDTLRISGATKGKNVQERLEAVTRALEGNPSPEANAQVAAWIRKNFDEIGDEAVAAKLKVYNPLTGELQPFEKIPHYVPIMFKKGIQNEIDELLKTIPEGQVAGVGWLKGPRVSKAAERIAKEMNISVEQAKNIIHQHAVTPRRVGHLEMARTQFPEELKPLLERNPVALFTRYAEQAIPRIELAKRFGPEYEKMSEQLIRMQNNGMSPELADELGQIVRGVKPASRWGSGNMLRGAMALQVLGKLGPTTSVMNLGEQSKIVVREGLGSWMKSVGAQLSPTKRRQYIGAYLGGLRGHLEMMTGAGESATGLQKAAQKWLDVTLFTPIEKTNRLGAAAAGHASAVRLAKEANQLRQAGKAIPKKLQDKLTEYGVKAQDLDDFARTGQFSRATEGIVGLRAARVTQQPTSVWEMPPAWRTPEMRLFLQFKRFAYNQSRFLYEEIAKPAYRWFETNGVEGDLGPMLRAMAVFPPAGVAVGMGREGVRDMQAWFLGAKRRPSRNDFDNHPTATVLRNMLYVGAFGMAGDVLERSYRSGLSDYLLGPTVSDITDMGERMAKAGYKAAAEGEYPRIEDMMLQAFAYYGRGAAGVSPQELTTISSRRGLPGAVRGAWEGLGSQR